MSYKQKVVIGDAGRCGIYTITHIQSGKKYVGSSVNMVRRWNQHRSDLSLLRHKSPKLQAAWRKHGAEAFRFDVVEIVLDASSLIRREQAWIDGLQASTAGYNHLPAAGSRIGTKHSPETRKKLVEARRLRVCKPCSEETKKKLSEAQKGKKKPACTDEYRMRMSIAMKGMKKPARTEKYKAEVAAIRTGTKASEATKAKMAASQRARWAAIKGESHVL